MKIEVINEPQPKPKGYSTFGGHVTLRLIDSKTGKQVGQTEGGIRRNEKTLREERKY